LREIDVFSKKLLIDYLLTPLWRILAQLKGKWYKIKQARLCSLTLIFSSIINLEKAYYRKINIILIKHLQFFKRVFLPLIPRQRVQL